MSEYIQFIFSGKLVQSKVFCLRVLRASSVAWFTQNKFLTELISPVSSLHMPYFAHISNLDFILDIVLNGEKRLSFFFIFDIFGCNLWDLIKKKALFLGRGNVNILIRGVVAAVCVTRNHSNFTAILFFLFS